VIRLADPSPVPDLLGQDLDMGLVRTIAPFLASRTFVDVGAERGSVASALIALGLRGVLFEPLPRHFATLSRLTAQGGATAHPWAIDERDGERDLHVATNAAGDELDYFHSLQRVDNETRFRHSRKLRVTCRSISSLALEGIVPDPLGVLKTDTEGNDLAVLKGMGSLRPELAICEFFTEELYHGWGDARPELAIELMASLGYRRVVAVKRLDELEYCAASPMGFLPRQWGNLFFFSDSLYDAAESAIARFLGEAEARFIGAMQSIAADRVAKEAVIQGLLKRERDAGKTAT
jgi:FkbM family methyltransferase